MERIKNTGLDDMMPSNVCKWTGIFLYAMVALVSVNS